MADFGGDSFVLFLSTPSARRATRYSLPVQVDRSISIHALREEGDRRGCGGLPLLCIFLSTPSARRATGSPTYSASQSFISIHALREEGDHGAFSYLRSPL